MFNRSKLTHLYLAIIALFFASAIIPKIAAAQDQDDPPGLVGRVSYVQGSVSFQPAGTEDWAAAEMNRPITIGDKLWADQDSLVEVGLGSAAIRLGSNTAFTILNLDDNVTQVSIAEGTINVHLRQLDDNDSFEVDTPNLAFSLLRTGDYRVSVNENGDATIINVRNGEGEVTGGGQAFAVHAGQSASVNGTDQLDAELGDVYPDDAFDTWCLQRNRRADDVPRYVSPQMVGYDELNSNGNWREVPEYGAMWVPNGVAADWAPYRYGHWVWISPWGWTWVDDASWGFAPFHYGRWVQVGGAWGWLPGPVVVAVRPVYAPALVAWVGSPGGGVAIGVGAGVAWFPLGPREVFVPPYAVSPRYVTQINITNTNVTNVYVTNVYRNYTVNKTVTNVTYVNRTYVTATSQNAFSTGQPIARNLGRVDARAIARAPIGTAVGAGVVPQQRSLVAASAVKRKVAQPPARFAARPVVAKRPPPPPPVSFAARENAIKANGGKPLSAAQVNSIRTTAPAKGASAAAPPAVKIAPPVRAGNPPPKNNFGNRPAQPAGNARPAPAQPSAPARPAAPEKPADNDANRPAGNNNMRPVVPPAKPPAAAPPNQPPARPAPAQPETNRPAPPPERSAPATVRTPPADNRPPATKPPAENPPPAKPAPPTRPAPAQTPPPAKPESTRPANPPPAAKPADRPNKPAPEEKKKDDKKEKGRQRQAVNRVSERNKNPSAPELHQSQRQFRRAFLLLQRFRIRLRRGRGSLPARCGLGFSSFFSQSV